MFNVNSTVISINCIYSVSLKWFVVVVRQREVAWNINIKIGVHNLLSEIHRTIPQ